MPSGYSILGDTETPPSGYTYTGYSLYVASGWEQKTAMLTSRRNCGAAAVNGRIYVVGDAWADGNVNEAYDTAKDSWASKAVMPTLHKNPAMAVVGGYVYVIGGTDDGTISAANDRYDPIGDGWVSLTAMPTARHGPRAAAIGNTIYVIGGKDYSGSTGIDVGYNEAYSIGTDTWNPTPAQMPTGRRNGAVHAVSGMIYAIGGNTSDRTPSNANEEYNPGTNTWTAKAPFPAAAYNFASAVINDKIYLATGRQLMASMRIYDPSTDTWSPGDSMPGLGLYWACGAALGGKLYAFGEDFMAGNRQTWEWDSTRARSLYVHRRN